MPNNVGWPLVLEDVFFVDINLSRQPSLPDNIEIQLLAEAKINLRNHKQLLQINVKLRSDDDMPLKMSVLAIGLFRYIDNKADENHELIADYVNRFALPIVWSFIKTNLRTISSSMGMPSINIPMPDILFVPIESMLSQEHLVEKTDQ